MGERLSTEATTEQSVVSEQSSLLLTAAERRARFVTLHVQTEMSRRWRGTGTSAVKHQSPCFDVRAHPGHWPFPILVCRHDRRNRQLCSWRCFWSSSAWSNSGKAVTAILPSHCLSALEQSVCWLGRTPVAIRGFISAVSVLFMCI